MFTSVCLHLLSLNVNPSIHPRAQTIGATLVIFCIHMHRNMYTNNKGMVYFDCIWATAWQNQQNDVRPAKTQISLGIHPVWSESSLAAWRNFGSLATHWADTQADLSLRWVHKSFCWFCHAATHFFALIGTTPSAAIFFNVISETARVLRCLW